MEEGRSSTLREIVKSRTKNWSKIYSDKLDQRAFDNEERRAKNATQGNTFDSFIGRLRVNKLLINTVRARLKTSFHSVRRTVENSSAPIFPTPNWPDYSGSQAFCDYCRKPALSGCIMCTTCTVIYHKMCYDNAKRARYVLKPSEIVDLDEDDDERFICIHCEESTIYHKKLQQRNLRYLIEKRNKDGISRYLARFLYSYALRKRFLKIRMGLTTVQSMFRRKIDRRAFLVWKRSESHVIVLEMRKIQLAHNIGTVTVTLVDPMKSFQIMRIDKIGSKWSEEGMGIITSI